MKSVYVFNAPVLFNLAREAYERTRVAPSETSPCQTDALAAALFSAATLESFIMEVALVSADAGGPNNSELKSLEAFGAVLGEAESSRASVRLKFLIGKSILSGASFNKGSKPYQDFDLLFSLRDAIVHLKPVEVSGTPSKIATQLAARGLCAREEPATRTNWLERIATRSVARWSCNVVVDMVTAIIESLPPFFQMFWRHQYERVS